jgi:hypothetical protein
MLRIPARLRRALAIVAALFLGSLALGCRHLEVLDAGPPGPGLQSRVIVDFQTSDGVRPEGVLVEIFREDGELATRFTTDAAGATDIPDLPPGAYRVRVDTRPLGGGRVFEKSFAIAPGQSIAIVYDDGAATRAALADFGVEVAKGTGFALLVVVLVAADVAIVVASGGRAGPVCCRAALGK